MKIGIIGAGKAGVTLGRYFKENGLSVSGFYSRSLSSAKEASEFTETVYYETVEAIVQSNDVLFLTVPDGMIEKVWEQVRQFQIKDKMICHSSGILSSDIFSGISQAGAYGYSIHPLFAISSRWDSYKLIKNAYFTVEGHERYRMYWKDLLKQMGNPVCLLTKEQKIRYHAAAVFASNQVIALLKTAQDLLVSCGFEAEAAEEALMPLFLHNSQTAAQKGLTEALTGPVERGDLSTIMSHMGQLSKEGQQLYILLSKKLLGVAKTKNPDRDYREMEQYLSSF